MKTMVSTPQLDVEHALLTSQFVRLAVSVDLGAFTVLDLPAVATEERPLCIIVSSILLSCTSPYRPITGTRQYTVSSQTRSADQHVDIPPSVDRHSHLRILVLSPASTLLGDALLLSSMSVIRRGALQTVPPAILRLFSHVWFHVLLAGIRRNVKQTGLCYP